MTKLYVEDTELTSVADAIRQRGGTSGALSFPAGFNSAIAAIPGGAVIPKITNMANLFVGRENLIQVLLPACDDITGAEQAFSGLSNLQSADLSAIGFGTSCALTGLFSQCSSLASVKLPEDDTHYITHFGSIFTQCASLTEADMSCMKFSATNNYSCLSAFYGCTSLKKVALPQRDTACVMSPNFFVNCSALEEVIIPGDVVLPVYMSNAFNGSSIEAGTCLIYVPDALVDSYKAATNWSTYSDQIKGFSDYPGTPWWHSGTN